MGEAPCPLAGMADGWAMDYKDRSRVITISGPARHLRSVLCMPHLGDIAAASLGLVGIGDRLGAVHSLDNTDSLRI